MDVESFCMQDSAISVGDTESCDSLDVDDCEYM